MEVVSSFKSPASPDFSVKKEAISAPGQVHNDGKNVKTVGFKPSAPRGQNFLLRNIPSALEEERKVKAVFKRIPIEIETDDIKDDLERQEYPVYEVHRMHRRDVTALGLALVIVQKMIKVDKLLKLSRVWSLRHNHGGTIPERYSWPALPLPAIWSRSC
ncbi:hypothetical protein EVAR_52597_1 [Eumeta japonica]|uniref:Uncharacterized protein n=1 Tax=Eumeta variegata TaxID=151549 RepID=A0A4C1YQL3_EUMVA|nr:hypothetical protein EVAR_52597_1 [Eumeta japonica]